MWRQKGEKRGGTRATTNSLDRDLNARRFFFCVHGVRGLLQHVHALRGGGLVEASHVVVHLGEALLHVVLGAALTHRPKAEAQRRVVQLKGGRGVKGETFVAEVDEGTSETQLISHSSQP